MSEGTERPAAHRGLAPHPIRRDQADPAPAADGAPEGELTLRTLAQPADVNVNGDIFGGWVLAQMDIAGGIVAGATAEGRVATIAVDAMKFIRPVHVGDVLSIYAQVTRVGRTSMAISLEAWALRNRIGALEKVTEATFTYVAIDETGRPRPVPRHEDA